MSSSTAIFSTAADPLSAVSANGTSRAELGQDAFLTLMLAQLRNQDPLKPLEPQEFLGQLAQFSSVTGIQGMRDSVTELAGSLRSSQLLEGATLVGREVLASSDSVELGAEGGVSGMVSTPEGSSRIDVRIRDASGALVRQISLEPQAGMSSFNWDGLDARGVRVPSGSYYVEATAQIGNYSETTETLLQQRVDSVTFDAAGGGLTLNTTAGSLALGAVRRVM
ncbi:MAG: flagellar hook assembly protein FlgD [Sinobacteraceae bacterium]|nr:flagellar hook assembly protein FlgD [Nevskiaceae bacterium]MCP5359974.1 flagellar hook assembly protein FlgD [Nevskiaceae bacterium]MCP5472206.1 flagellar hook assembly protein FlgD [Nevskiaceae bacterium]